MDSVIVSSAPFLLHLAEELWVIGRSDKIIDVTFLSTLLLNPDRYYYKTSGLSGSGVIGHMYRSGLCSPWAVVRCCARNYHFFSK